MNRINVNRLIVSGLVTFLVFVGLEILFEYLIGYLWLGRFIATLRQPLETPASWGVGNVVLNLLIALMNSTLLIWLYAALRPMFGVGPRTALIAGAFIYIFILGFAVNLVNIRLLWPRVILPDLVYELFELPLAVIAGAVFYERGL